MMPTYNFVMLLENIIGGPVYHKVILHTNHNNQCRTCLLRGTIIYLIVEPSTSSYEPNLPMAEVRTAQIGG